MITTETNKLLQVASWATIITAIFLMLLVGFWMLYPYKTLTFKTSKYPVLNRSVVSGTSLSFISDYCKYIDLTATTSREFVDGVIYPVPETITNREKGCKNVIVTVPVPQELPSGKFHLLIHYVYRVNPLRTIVVNHETEEFNIINATESAEPNYK